MRDVRRRSCMKPRILVAEADRFSSRAVALLRQVGDVILADLDRADLLSAVREADVLWVRLRHRIDHEVITAGQTLKIIATPTTGLNHIDTELAECRGIRVLSLRGEGEFLKGIRATAEHTLSLCLALLRHLPAAATHVRDGGWNRDLFRGSELCGRTIGVIGYGRLGQLVTRYLKALDARILVSDPNAETRVKHPDIAWVSLRDLLERADLVTLHVNLSHTTRGFFGWEQFAAMKEGTWFVNTARGELVDEAVLLAALRSGRLAGAALDVLSDERYESMRDHPLVAYAREHDNVIITPHIGGCTVESMEKTEVFLSERLRTLIQEGALGPWAAARWAGSSI